MNSNWCRKDPLKSDVLSSFFKCVQHQISVLPLVNCEFSSGKINECMFKINDLVLKCFNFSKSLHKYLLIFDTKLKEKLHLK